MVNSKAKSKTTMDIIHNFKKVVNHQVAQLAKEMSKTAVVDDEMADSTHSVALQENCNGKCGGGGNRSNPSLTRQKQVMASDARNDTRQLLLLHFVHSIS